MMGLDVSSRGCGHVPRGVMCKRSTKLLDIIVLTLTASKKSSFQSTCSSKFLRPAPFGLLILIFIETASAERFACRVTSPPSLSSDFEDSAGELSGLEFAEPEVFSEGILEVLGEGVHGEGEGEPQGEVVQRPEEEPVGAEDRLVSTRSYG